MSVAKSQAARRESPFAVTRDTNIGYYRFAPKKGAEFDEQDFSASEIQAMQLAWGVVTGYHRGKKGEDYFHDPDTFMGRAWNAAKDQNDPIDWETVFDAYDELNHCDHSATKAIAATGVK